MTIKQPKIKNNVAALVAAMLSTGSAAVHADVNIDPMQTMKTAKVAPVTNRIIVKYRDGGSDVVNASAAADRTKLLSFATNAGLQYVRSTANNAQVLKLDKAKSLDEVQAIADQIAAEPDVLYAEPDQIMHAQAIPSDPEYFQQWHYYEPEGGINLPEAWDIATGANTVVAVIDTGVRPHIDLAGQLLPGYDFISDPQQANDGDGREADATDPGDWVHAGSCGNGQPQQNTPSSWHGTHVAGTIAAASNNGEGVAGVAWDANILPLRVLGKCGGSMADIADAMRWAAGLEVPGAPLNPNPAKVLNLSLGGRGECSRTYQEAIQAVRAAGASIVVAAGNDGQDASQYSPANCEGVITVAATNREGGGAFYSNFGEIVDVAAPGGETFDPNLGVGTLENGILSTVNSGNTIPGQDSIGSMQGTSMAAPHVAGVAALLYGLNPELTPDDVEAVITGTARAFPGAQAQCDTQLCGAGIVDAAAAVNAAANGQVPEGLVNQSDVAIPDFDTRGAASTIDVTTTGDAGVITLDIDVKHTYRGDLSVQLIAPNGASATLKAVDENDAQANFQQRFTIDATGINAAGSWSLFVADLLQGDTGYIDSWSINFE